MCFAPQRRALFQHLNFQKWSDIGVLYILTRKCASRHNGVHFFDISTSKSGPTMVCFVHFDFEMCFAPQRRALFRHRNFQKWSDAEVFCTFWLGNVLRATTACTFLTSQLPKVVRDRQFLTLLTSKCASHHNGVQFFIAPVASWLRTRRFSEPTFRPSGATNHWKNTVFRDFPTFSRICIFCLLTLSLLIFSLLIFLFSLPLPCSAFHLSILSEVWLLNFLRSGPKWCKIADFKGHVYIYIYTVYIYIYSIIASNPYQGDVRLQENTDHKKAVGFFFPSFSQSDPMLKPTTRSCWVDISIATRLLLVKKRETFVFLMSKHS